MLFEVPPGGMAEPDPRLVYLQTMLGAIEMLKARRHGGARRRVPQSASDAGVLLGADAGVRGRGLRATVSINHQNLVEYEKCRSSTSCCRPRSAPRWTARRARRRRRWPSSIAGTLSTWHGAENGRLRIAVSNSAPQRVSEDYFAFLSALQPREHDLPFNIHMLETKTQRVLGADDAGASR